MVSVLVVDDDRAVRENLLAFLEDEGMRLSEAESGEAAVELASEACDFELCVMDLRLPGMDGNATVVAMHALQPQLLFLIHTGSVNYALPPELRAMGMKQDHVFMKPLADMGVLADAIRRLCGR